MQRFSVFSHLSSQKSEEYRQVLQVFASARAEFVIHLRPAELARETGLSEGELEPVLEQLAEWGNLDRSHDHIDASTVEEFYRVKWLYQLSRRGEAAELALRMYEDSLHQPGELQTEALREIIDYLDAMAHLLGSEGVTRETADYGKLFQQLRDLNAQFEEFTVQAQRFMQFLQSTIELHELTEEDFIDYKDRLIEYLRRFVNELITSSAEIEGKLDALERNEIRDYFPGMAKRARADALDPDEPQALEEEQQKLAGKWEGLRRWFLGDGAGRSQAETLRARAREAIPSLLVALQSFHDRRESGSDRRRDWTQLARWFAEAPDDRSAHRLWRVAFGLGPARHLRINEETLARREQSNEGGRTSWLNAEPMWLEPQLRKIGRASPTGRPAELIDLSKERAHLRRFAERENKQLALAREHIATDGEARLSEFAKLDTAAFDLLMEMLGRAVSKAAHREANEFPVTAHSTDGSLVIALRLPETVEREARIECEHGAITGPDYRVSIQPVETTVSDSGETSAEKAGEAAVMA